MVEPDARSELECDAGAGAQRLDKWLWFARVVKTRTLAAGLVKGGNVRVNAQRVDQPAKAVRPGDVLTIALERRVLVLQVRAPGARRGPFAEAARLYKDLSEPVVAVSPAAGERDHGSGRPTKRARRALARLSDRFED